MDSESRFQLRSTTGTGAAASILSILEAGSGAGDSAIVLLVGVVISTAATQMRLRYSESPGNATISSRWVI
jgi:hypothetical protein